MKETEQEMKTGLLWLWVVLGSGLGGVVRTWVEAGFARLAGEGFPFGILTVNLLGSFAIGCFAARLGLQVQKKRNAVRRAFWMVGFCGGFTTFSLFSFQTVELLMVGRGIAAASHLLLTVTGGVLAVWAGLVVGRIPGSRGVAGSSSAQASECPAEEIGEA